jgi:rhodanese-related sulfurtransferase
VPLSRLELKFARLVPRKGTRIVLVDDNDGLAARAAAVLAENGYSDVAILDGGNAAWAAAGYELFSGVYVPSKAFGEFIEHDCDTPNITADELAALNRDRAAMVIHDSRPLDEFVRVSIPTATNAPGAELVLRARDMAPSPDTLVVINCAGRTRSIIGAQSLINAGLPNKVVALRNGTMGFTLAGHTCDSGKTGQAPRPSTDALAWAQSAAAQAAVPPSRMATSLSPFSASTAAARAAKPSLSSTRTMRVPLRGTKRAKLSSSRLSGTQRAQRRCDCE